MKITLSLAEKLLRLQNGEQIPSSQLQNPVVTELLEEGILYRPGKRRSNIYIADYEQFKIHIYQQYGIANLNEYVETLRRSEIKRADLVKVSTDSKNHPIRTFTGFLLNSYEPIIGLMDGQKITLPYIKGICHFIQQPQKFLPGKEYTIVGIENPECFTHITLCRTLFRHITPLFVSRYPQSQSKDLQKWLESIPNTYLHFGDFDPAGINIYLHEYKKYLGDRAHFYVPQNINELLNTYGNKNRYDNQTIHPSVKNITEKDLQTLITLLHHHKKGLDQEILLL